MSLLDGFKGFAAGLRGMPFTPTAPNRPPINVAPALGDIQVVDTTKIPTRANIPGSWSRAWLGPGQPFSTMLGEANSVRDKDAELEPRTFQYVSSVNSTMSPRLAYGLLAFSDLRAYAESVPEVSMCLRLLTEEMKAFVPTIVEGDGETKVPGSEYEWMTIRPDGFNPFPVWLSRFLYNTLIYDAGCAYMVRNSRHKIVASRVIDGSTIFVLVDERGEQPRPPAPAFQQIIWGTPRLMLNTRQLWYKPRHLRADAPYGRSPIEDALPAVKLLQSLWDYEYQKYQVGNIPEMVFAAPENWKDNVDAILDFEEAFNARMSGSNQERVRARFMPAGTQALQTKELSFNEESYNSSTNAVRMAFGILQSEVGEGPSAGLGGKGYAEAMQSAFYRMGLAPLISYVESHFNDIMHMNGNTQLKFKMAFPPESLDPQKEEEKYSTRFQIGGITRDEYREGIGMQKMGGEEGAFIVSPGGGGEEEGGDPFADMMGGGGKKPGMINVGNSHNVQVRRPLKVAKNPVKVLNNPVAVAKFDRPDIEQAKKIGDELGVDWNVVDPDEFTEGLAEETEHAETVDNDISTMAQIALDHLSEDPHYYSKLKAAMTKFDRSELLKYCGVDPKDDMLFGSPVSDFVDANMPAQGANESKIVSIGGGAELDARPAVWKPASGEKEKLRQWIHGELYRRAEAAYLLDRELAPDEKHYLVPVAYTAEVDGEKGSVQHYVTGRQPREEVSTYGSEWVEQAAVLDYIMGQVDRNRKNWLTHPHDDRRPVLIDSDLSFSPDPKQHLHSSFIDAMRDRPLTERTLDAIYAALGNHDLWEDLQDVLEDEDAVACAKQRAQELYDNKRIMISEPIEVVGSGNEESSTSIPSTVMVKFDENEARDESGKWTSGGAGGSADTKSIPAEQTEHMKTHLAHSNGTVEFKSPRYMIVHGKNTDGNDQSVKIRTGVTDGKLRVFFSDDMPAEEYTSFESAFEDALNYVDAKHSKWNFENQKEVAAEGENEEEGNDLSKADFEESKHPRDNDGKFTSKGSEGSGVGAKPKASAPAKKPKSSDGSGKDQQNPKGSEAPDIGELSYAVKKFNEPSENIEKDFSQYLQSKGAPQDSADWIAQTINFGDDDSLNNVIRMFSVKDWWNEEIEVETRETKYKFRNAKYEYKRNLYNWQQNWIIKQTTENGNFAIDLSSVPSEYCEKAGVSKRGIAEESPTPDIENASHVLFDEYGINSFSFVNSAEVSEPVKKRFLSDIVKLARSDHRIDAILKSGAIRKIEFRKKPGSSAAAEVEAQNVVIHEEKFGTTPGAFIHELGHILDEAQYYYSESDEEERKSRIERHKAFFKGMRPSSYGWTNTMEDYAESFVNWISGTNQDVLKERFDAIEKDFEILKTKKLRNRYA